MAEGMMSPSDVAVMMNDKNNGWNDGIIQAIQAEGNATRQMMQQNLIDEQNRRIANLEMQNAMAGVVRYPMSTAYNAGFNPFCNCGTNGCGCM